MHRQLVRFFKFGVVGVLGVLVNLVVFGVMREFAGLTDFFAKAVGIEVSILHNFGWNFAWTWGDRGRTVRSFFQRLVKYHGSTFIASFVVTIAVSYLARIVVDLVPWSDWFAWPPLLAAISQEQWTVYISYLVGIAAGMVANFILSDRWVFKQVARREGRVDERGTDGTDRSGQS